MNAAVAKLTIKQHFQNLTDEQLRNYHLTHDYFSGRPLAEPVKPSVYEESADVQKTRRVLKRMNEVLYPTPTLGNVLSDALADLKLLPESTQETQAMPMEKPSEDLVNRAKSWFTQYQAEGLESLLPAQSARLTEMNLELIKRAFSYNTVLIQNVCTLSEFWIRSPQDWDEQSGQSLFEHLFVEYEAPAFLKSCWSRVADEENIQWLLCYIMYVQGGSLKVLASHFAWTPVSNKIWHQLFACPVSMLPEQAVLYAEFKRLGGWAEDFRCLMSNEAYVIDLLDPVSEESRALWYDVCRWTINKQFELTADQHRKVLWWARHQFTEFARNDESYCLQGRSLAKVLESIATYEDEQALIARARARLAERGRQVSMARNEAREQLREQERQAQEDLLAGRNTDYYFDDEKLRQLCWKPRGWNYVIRAHGKAWSFRELTTGQELYDEGEAMEHCVGGYISTCYEGDALIFSLRSEGRREATIEIDPLTCEVIQIQRRLNADAKKSHLNVLRKWVADVVQGKCDF